MDSEDHMITPKLAAPLTNGYAGSQEVGDEVFVLPTTVGQKGFCYLELLQPGNTAYNIAVRFRLQGPLRSAELEWALNEIVRRHEVLRTTFAVLDGKQVQVVSPHLHLTLAFDDLRGVAEKNRADQARIRSVEEGSAAFDLAHGPLLRARLLRLAEDDHTLLVTIHHSVSDGWSIGILTRELGVLYDARCRRLPSPLPELALQYGDFAVWQEQWLRSKDLDRQLAFWKRQLANLPILEVPTDRPRPVVQTFRGHIESVLLPRKLTDDMEALSSRAGATLFMLMLAAMKILLQRTTGRNDVYVGSVLAGRSRVELESLIGLFINPLVFRTDLSGDPSFLELLERVRDTVLGAVANQDVPFERVVDAVQPKRDPGRNPVFQINFLYQRDFVQPFDAAGVTLTAIPSVSPGAIYDLNFFMVERAEGWRASCEFNTDLYDKATIVGLLGQYQRLLEGITASPRGRISAFSLRSAVVEAVTPPTVAEPAGPASVAPRDAIEARLVELWKGLLVVERVGVTEDFFDLGGNSLLAARMLVQLEKAFGKRLPLALLLQDPTIASLAAYLRKEDRKGAEGQPALPDDTVYLGDGKWVDPGVQVFPMRRQGSRPPLILVDAGPYQRPLVRTLGDDQPVYGLALPELSALPPSFTVRDIATNLVDALCATSIEGPYHLAGWSLAGVIAYEAVRLLRERGKQVASLILFDTNSPAYLRGFKGWKNYPVRLYFVVEKCLYHIRKMSRLGWRAAWRYFRERLQGLRLFARRNDALSVVSLPAKQDERSLNNWVTQYVVAAEYEAEPCEVPLVLFRSEALQTGWFRDPQLGWGKVSRRGLQVYELPGDHNAMFVEPVVRQLGSYLTEWLEG
jgi:thioesterase domain-containing protein/acyl carrier protein